MKNLMTNADLANIARICSLVSNRSRFNYDDSEDLRSRTCLKLLESKSYDPTRALEPYVRRIATNVAKDMKRENARRMAMCSPIDRMNEDGDWGVDHTMESVCASESEEASFQVDMVDLWNASKSFMNRLSEIDRAILKLYSYNVGREEIADRLGCSPNSVSVRLCRLRKLVKKGLVA